MAAMTDLSVLEKEVATAELRTKQSEVERLEAKLAQVRAIVSEEGVAADERLALLRDILAQ